MGHFSLNEHPVPRFNEQQQQANQVYQTNYVTPSFSPSMLPIMSHQLCHTNYVKPTMSHHLRHTNYVTNYVKPTMSNQLCLTIYITPTMSHQLCHQTCQSQLRITHFSNQPTYNHPSILLHHPSILLHHPSILLHHPSILLHHHSTISYLLDGSHQHTR